MTPEHNSPGVAAIAAALADPNNDRAALLTSIVTVAKTVFCAAASSIALLDESTGELVFEAISGEGEHTLIGSRFPADRGIAGWVVASGQPLIVDKLASNSLFAWDVAESTGYIPGSIMAVPVSHNGRNLGVLEVLDPHPDSRASLPDLDLLTMLAAQAAIALASFTRSHAIQAASADSGEHSAITALTAALYDSDSPQHQAAVHLVGAITVLLGPAC
jgi:GAF domain-containing protein